jgi:hypothetical protein
MSDKPTFDVNIGGIALRVELPSFCAVSDVEEALGKRLASLAVGSQLLDPHERFLLLSLHIALERCRNTSPAWVGRGSEKARVCLDGRELTVETDAASAEEICAAARMVNEAVARIKTDNLGLADSSRMALLAAILIHEEMCRSRWPDISHAIANAGDAQSLRVMGRLSALRRRGAKISGKIRDAGGSELAFSTADSSAAVLRGDLTLDRTAMLEGLFRRTPRGTASIRVQRMIVID